MGSYVSVYLLLNGIDEDEKVEAKKNGCVVLHRGGGAIDYCIVAASFF